MKNEAEFEHALNKLDERVQSDLEKKTRKHQEEKEKLSQRHQKEKWMDGQFFVGLTLTVSLRSFFTAVPLACYNVYRSCDWQSLSALSIIAGEKLVEAIFTDKISSTALAHIGSAALLVKIGLIAVCIYNYFSKDAGKSQRVGNEV